MVERNKRVSDVTRGKISKLFKLVLDSIEEETGKFNIDKSFFGDNNREGFGLIRKVLLDEGNDLGTFLDILFDKVDLVPRGGVIDISKYND